MSSLKQRRAELLEQLVLSVVGPHPRFDTLARSCKDQADFHSFLDTNPSVVDSDLLHLTERIQDDAQFDKATVLSALAHRLISLDLPSSQLDFPSRVLSFLLAASRNALHTQLDPALLALAPSNPLQQQRLPSPPRQNPLFEWDDEPAGSEDEWWQTAIPYSPDDDLSQWSGDEGEEADDAGGRRNAFERRDSGGSASLEGDGSGGASAAQRSSPAASLLERGGGGGEIMPADGGFLTPLPAASRQHRRWPGLRPSPRLLEQRGRRKNPYGPTSLSVWLAAKASGGHPARHLDPRLCCSDAALAAQVIDMLKGVSQPGPAFIFDAAVQAYRGRHGVHTPDCAPATAAALLERFATLATHLRQLKTFCDWVAFGEESEAGLRALRALPTVAAFAAIVAQQVQAVRGQLVALEASMKQRGPGQAPTSLVELRLQLVLIGRQVAALHPVVAQCQWQGSAAATAATVLDAVEAALGEAMMRPGLQGGLAAGLLAEVHAAAMKPTLDAIDDWLRHGSLRRAPPEFFIQKRPHTGGAATAGVLEGGESGGHGGFWRDGYELEKKDDGSVAAPAAVAAVAAQILEAGLATVGIKQQQGGGGQRATSPDAVLDLPELHAEFCAALSSLVSRSRHATTPSGQFATDPAALPLPSALLSRTWALEPINSQPQPSPVSSALNFDPSKDSSGAGQCREEWEAAVARGKGGPLLAPLCEDLLDLPPVPATPLGLPAASLCPAATAFYDGGTATTSTAAAALDGTEGRSGGATTTADDLYLSLEGGGTAAAAFFKGRGQLPGGHPIGAAMRRASTARVAQAKAGRAEATSAEFFTSKESPQPSNGAAAAATAASPEVSKWQWQNARDLEESAASGLWPWSGCAIGGEWAALYHRTAAALSLDGIEAQQRQQQAQQFPGMPTAGVASIAAAASGKGWFEAYRSSNIGHSHIAAAGAPSLLPSESESWATSLPLRVLMERCLLLPIQQRIHATESRACAAVMAAGLLNQLTSLQCLAGAAGPELEPFVQHLLAHSSTSRGVDGVSPFELNAALQEALAVGGAALAGIAAASVEITQEWSGAPYASPSQTAAANTSSSMLAALTRVELEVRPAFPLCLLADAPLLRLHTRLHTLSLQLRWVTQSLTAARAAGWKSAPKQRSPTAAAVSSVFHFSRAAQQEMLHVASVAQTYAMTRLEGAGTQLQRDIAACGSLAAMQQCCRDYAHRLQQACLLGIPGGPASLIAALDAALRHCILLAQARKAAALVAEREGEGQAAEQQILILRSLAASIAGSEREFATHRKRLFELVAGLASEAGAHGDEARALLAALDADGRWPQQA